MLLRRTSETQNIHLSSDDTLLAWDGITKFVRETSHPSMLRNDDVKMRLQNKIHNSLTVDQVATPHLIRFSSVPWNGRS
jgi:hypothetical protein